VSLYKAIEHGKEHKRDTFRYFMHCDHCPWCTGNLLRSLVFERVRQDEELRDFAENVSPSFVRVKKEYTHPESIVCKKL